jgi:adenylylsulfate kinase
MAWVVWFTGLPGCGKTTIAKRVEALLHEKGIDAKTLQLDEIRKVITPYPRYTEEEREIVYASLTYMAKLLMEAGKNVIIDATANRQRYRDLARKQIPIFGEVFIQAPLNVCMDREAKRKAEFAPRDIYKKAVLERSAVPGVNVAYEEPQNPEIKVDTAILSPEESASFIAEKIIERFGSES